MVGQLEAVVVDVHEPRLSPGLECGRLHAGQSVILEGSKLIKCTKRRTEVWVAASWARVSSGLTQNGSVRFRLS